ncbi:MAG: Rossmann-like and DUF2520 domain-containing protein [Bacteroidales bacterium]|nr:Rossmann-like and DUF2520 domain-containing protein [Bacteroidales bacterium]
MPEIKNIVIIGAGNVGTHLALALKKAGYHISQVAGRKEFAVVSLARALDTEYTFSFDEINKSADLYLMALPDGVMGMVLPHLGLHNGLLVHTSGSVPIDILKPYSANTGVLYPLQTFTRIRAINLQEVPFMIEASNTPCEEALSRLAAKLSDHVYTVDSIKRQELHIAAVFASNFSNHMLNMSRLLMEVHGLDFALLAPLIRETTAKALELGPQKAQTGPALRKDMEIIEKHIAMLKDKPKVQELYRLITQNIIDQNK